MLFSETLPFAVMQAVFISISDYMGVSPHFIKGAGGGGGNKAPLYTAVAKKKKHRIGFRSFRRADLVGIDGNSVGIYPFHLRPRRSGNSCSETIIPQKLPPRRDPVKNLRGATHSLLRPLFKAFQ